MKMKTKIFSLISAAALALGFVSCTDDNWNPSLEKEGELRLSSMDVSIDTKENLQSRATYDVSNFIVELHQGDNIVAKYTYSAMPEIVKLSQGDYTAVVYSHEVQKAEWDNPYFLGKKDFKIQPNVITEIGTVSCKFASVKVTIEFDSDLMTHMADDCQVKVVANDEGTLIFGRDETRAGYFEVIDGSITLVATFQGTVDGAAFDEKQLLPKQISDVAPGTHYHLKYSYKKCNTDIPDETGNVSLDGDSGTGGIEIDYSATDVNDGFSIDISDDVIDEPGTRPGTEDPIEPEDPEDPEDPDDPSVDITFTSETLVFAPATNGTDVTPAIVKIHSGEGFAHLNVVINSDNDNFIASAGEVLPLSFDLVNPGDAGDALSSIGFPVGNEFDGKTDIDFNISDMVPLLAAFPGTHKFTIEVVDTQDNKKGTSLIIIAQ